MAYLVPFPDQAVFCERNDLEFIYPGQSVLPNDNSAALLVNEGPNSEVVTSGVATLNQVDVASIAEAAEVHQFANRAVGAKQTVEIPFWSWPNRIMRAQGTAQSPTFSALHPDSIIYLNRVFGFSNDTLGRYVQFQVTVHDENASPIFVIAPAGCYWNAGGFLFHSYRPRFPQISRNRSFLRANPYSTNPLVRFGLTPSFTLANAEQLAWYNGDGIPGNPQSRDVKVTARLPPQRLSLPQSPDFYGPYSFRWIEDMEYLNAQAASRAAASGNQGQSEPPGPSGQAEAPEDDPLDGDPAFEARVNEAAKHIFDEGYAESNGVDKG